MVYGEQKSRDMARSLLPSRWRKGARQERAFHHRAARRHTHEEMARLARDPEESDGLDLSDVEGEEARGLRAVVCHRRGADKVNPFIRWATAVTKELPHESRLSFVRGCMPRGVIGEHALQHLKRAPAFEDPREREWWMRRWGGRSHRDEMDRGEYAELLRGVLRAGGHGLFNRWMRARHIAAAEMRRVPEVGSPDWGRYIERKVRLRSGAIEPRLLLGMHDVLPFLDAVGRWAPRFRTVPAYRPNTVNPEWFTAMDLFLRAFKQSRGDLEATLRSLRLPW